MENRIELLWIDDEHSELNNIKSLAEIHGFNLTCYESAEKGLSELELNYHSYDGILLDGEFFMKTNQVKGTASDAALIEAYVKLQVLYSNKKIAKPWFLLSGKEQFVSKNHSIFSAYPDLHFFDKTNREDVKRIFPEIKSVIEESEFNLRIKYSKAFNLCNDRYIGKNAANELFIVLNSFENPEARINDKLYFTSFRVVLEKLFRLANKHGFLHDNCISDWSDLKLAASSKFLAGRRDTGVGVYSVKPYFPKLISNHVRTIIDITSSAVHSDKESFFEFYNLEEYKRVVNTPYVLYCLAFQLLDVMIWFKSYIDEHNDPEVNKLELNSSQLYYFELRKKYRGSIEKDENGELIFFYKNGFEPTFLPPYFISKYDLKSGDQVIVSLKLTAKGIKVNQLDLAEK